MSLWNHIFGLAAEPVPPAYGEEEIGFWQDIWISIRDWWDELLVSYRGVDPENNGSLTLVFVIIGLCLGIVAAVWVVTLSKRRYGPFVRRLLHEDCNSPANAKTLGELEYADKRVIRAGLVHSVDLRRVVRCREEEDALAAATPAPAADLADTADASDTTDASDAAKVEQDVTEPANDPVHVEPVQDEPNQVDFDLKGMIARDEAHFYIREKDLYLAGSRYDKKAERLFVPILATAAMIVVMFLLLKWMPGILNTAGNLVENI